MIEIVIEGFDPRRGKNICETYFVSPCPFCQSKEVGFGMKNLLGFASYKFICCKNVNCNAQGPRHLEYGDATHAWNAWGYSFDVEGELQRTLDLLRTGLPPDAFGMTMNEWADRKLDKAAQEISWMLNKIRERRNN